MSKKCKNTNGAFGRRQQFTTRVIKTDFEEPKWQQFMDRQSDADCFEANICYYCQCFSVLETGHDLSMGEEIVQKNAAVEARKADGIYDTLVKWHTWMYRQHFSGGYSEFTGNDIIEERSKAVELIHFWMTVFHGKDWKPSDRVAHIVKILTNKNIWSPAAIIQEKIQ